MKAIIYRSIMRRKICRMAGIPPFVLPAYPWLVELLRVEGIPKREWVEGRLVLRWGDTEVGLPCRPQEGARWKTKKGGSDG